MTELVLSWALVFVFPVEGAGRAIYMPSETECRQALKEIEALRKGWLGGVCVRAYVPAATMRRDSK